MRIQLFIFTSCLLFLFITPTSYAQEPFNLVYENTLDGFNKTAEDHGLTVIPGGFGEYQPGRLFFGSLRNLARRQYQSPLQSI